MKKYARILRVLPALSLICLAGTLAFSQPGDPGEDPDNPVPITGIELLIAAGAWLGFRKIKSMNKR